MQNSNNSHHHCLYIYFLCILEIYELNTCCVPSKIWPNNLSEKKGGRHQILVRTYQEDFFEMSGTRVLYV